MTRDEVLSHAWGFGAGGMIPEELAYLYDTCAGLDVLELGSMVGQSSYVLGSVARSLTCVDIWIDGCPFLEWRQAREYRVERMEAVFDANMRGLKFEKIKSFTNAAYSQLRGRRFDVILIDADHSAIGAARDIHRYRRLVRRGGLLMLHDYRSRAWRGVRRAARVVLKRRKPDKIIGALGVFKL